MSDFRAQSPLGDAASLLAEHAEGLRRLARHLVVDPADADDLTQETFLLALRRPEPPFSLGAWLRGVLRNKAREARRAERRRRSHEAQPRGTTMSPPTDPAETAARMEAHERVITAIRALSDAHRVPVWMHYFEGVPTRDIALRLEVPFETARTRLKRGLAELRERLDAVYGGERRAWMAALLPIAGAAPVVATGTAAAAVSSAASSSTGGAVATGSAIGPAKLVAVVVLAAACATTAYFALDNDGDDLPVRSVGAATGEVADSFSWRLK